MGGFVAFTLFFTVFGDRGLIKIYKLRKEIRKLKGVSEATQKHNDQLSEDVRRMKHEKTFQEHSAREALGLVQDNEIIYEFSD